MRKPKDGKTPKVRISITICPKLLRQLDKVTNNRSEFIEDATKEKITGPEQ